MPITRFCGIVPPHILQSIASSTENTESHREAASRSLACYRNWLHRHRPQPADEADAPAIGGIEDAIKARTKAAVSQIWAGGCHLPSKSPQDCYNVPIKGPVYKNRAVFSAENSDDELKLPGKLLRRECEAPVVDHQANDAYDNCGKVLDFYKTVLDWNSIDNGGMHSVSSVHFGKNFDNALWDPDNNQMVYGDGGTFLYDFARCVDVVGHEMTHGVTGFTSPLDYEDQSGALNEHISDTFGVMVKQWVDQQTAVTSNWLVGEGCFLPGVEGVALRSMKAPGTAFNDPRFGKDPQPGHMSAYKVIKDDFGGAHINSGIPNKAFYLTAAAFGGYSWEKAGQIWWKTMHSRRIPHQCTFVEFAEATTAAAEEMHGIDAARVVRHS